MQHLRYDEIQLLNKGGHAVMLCNYKEPVEGNLHWQSKEIERYGFCFVAASASGKHWWQIPDALFWIGTYKHFVSKGIFLKMFYWDTIGFEILKKIIMNESLKRTKNWQNTEHLWKLWFLVSWPSAWVAVLLQLSGFRSLKKNTFNFFFFICIVGDLFL